MFALCRTKILATIPSIRTVTTTVHLQKIFKIQSIEDFDIKVKNSKTPVIVDFYAT